MLDGEARRFEEEMALLSRRKMRLKTKEAFGNSERWHSAGWPSRHEVERGAQAMGCTQKPGQNGTAGKKKTAGKMKPARNRAGFTFR